MITRRAALGGGLAALAGVGGLLPFPGQLFAADTALGDRFALLLNGPYQKVTDGPDLGLSSVNLG
jgi:hypothetical protein